MPLAQLLPIFGIGLLLLIGLVLAAFGLRRQSQPDVVGSRLSQFTERTMTLEELELEEPFSQRVLLPLARSVLLTLGRYGPKQSQERLRVSLQQAGNPGNLQPLQFTGIRVGLAVVLFLIFGFVTVSQQGLTSETLMYTALGGGLGYLMPGSWLGSKIQKRKKEIVKALPDALDLLCISVEAGLSFDQGLGRVADKWDTELSREFRRMLSDVRLGRVRREALRDMSTRCGVEDVQTFVAAVIQAEQLGVSMSRILRIQSDQMRLRRRQRAEEEARKAPIKMLFPLAFLIFPSLFIVILGPAVPKITGGLDAASGS
jgi:tight adherence protein C